MSRFEPSSEERMVQEAARTFVADRMTLGAARALRDAREPCGFDPAVWAEMARLGWAGAAIDETHGGAGLGVRALALILEEMGRSLGAAPLASTALAAATLITRFADAETTQRWLPAMARGDVIAALAVDEGADDGACATRIRAGRISGVKRFVVDGMAAHVLLVAALHEDRPVLALVRADAEGVARTRIESIDGRGMANVDLRDAPIDAVLIGDEGRDPVDYARDCARIGLAAEMIGACGGAFEMTLDYLRTRRQFGQPIGGFQALQHRVAALLIDMELTRSCVFAAAHALHHDTADMPLLASLAKASAGDLMRAMAYETIQLHGGIGMTDAHDAGLYLKRGRVAALLHGDSAFHAARYATLKGY